MKLLKKDQVFMSDWLKLKPYSNPNLKYDNFYLNLCNIVYEILKEEEEFFDDKEMEREQIKQLACVIVSYYEDFISEIGIWNAFIEHNKATIGEYIPFYTTKDYDREYINWQDIAYLIWHYTTKWYDEKVHSADYQPFVELGKEIFESLEEYIDDSPATEHYEKLFTIKPNSDFFDFKTILNWFSTEGYMMGIEFGNNIKNQLESLSFKERLTPNFGVLVYQYKEDFLYRKRSSFGALNACEWLALVCRCSADKKQEIRELPERHSKHFVYEGQESKDFFKFRHYVTEREYLVFKDSFQKSVAKIKLGDICEMHLVKWDNKWWLSGAMIAYSQNSSERNLKEVKMKQIENQWILDEKALAVNREMAVDLENAFIQLYGSRLKLCSSVEEMQTILNDISRQNAKNKGTLNEFIDRENDRSASIEDTIATSLKKEFGKNTDLAVFYLKDQGTQMMVGAKETINALKAKTLSPEDSVELFISLSNGYAPQVAQYFLENYPTKNVKIPYSSQIDALKSMPYFWRFNSPEEFDKVYPLYTTVNDEQFEEMKRLD
jgi:hypothetical protein